MLILTGPKSRIVVLHLLLLLTARVSSGEPDPRLTIQINAPSTLVVGEPALVAVKLTGPTSLMFDGGSGKHFRVLIDRGNGLRPYQAPLLLPLHFETKRLALTEQTANIEYILGWDSSINDFVFPRAGQYRVVVEYEDGEHGVVRSNGAVIEVLPPAAEDAIVLEGIRRAGWPHVAVFEPRRLAPALSRLVSDFPRSRLLHRARLDDLEFRIELVAQGLDPDDLRAGRPPSAEQLAAFRRERFGRLVPLARELTEVETAFKSEALLRLAALQERTGDRTGSRVTLDRIIREHPSTRAAREARGLTQADE